MRDSVIDILQKENTRLEQLASHDELTGILNRRATEKIVSETMKKGGAILVCDLDNFKHVNDKYGHLMGDEVLKQASRLLRNTIRQTDLLGRIGGDEFVIFGYGIRNDDEVNILIKKIEKRFYEEYKHERLKVSLTIGGSVYCDGDCYDSLFGRADQILLSKKEVKRRSYNIEDNVDNWQKDMNQIQDELVEQILMNGSFCQDFESFKVIYRFLEREMRRNHQKACMVLFSIEDSSNQDVTPDDKTILMNYLGEILQSHLRLGDVYTRYSSCQYLVLLMDTDSPLAEIASKRIKDAFNETVQTDKVLLHYSYDLKPANIKD